VVRLVALAIVPGSRAILKLFARFPQFPVAADSAELRQVVRDRYTQIRQAARIGKVQAVARDARA
jgi:hypothetical protein